MHAIVPNATYSIARMHAIVANARYLTSQCSRVYTSVQSCNIIHRSQKICPFLMDVMFNISFQQKGSLSHLLLTGCDTYQELIFPCVVLSARLSIRISITFIKVCFSAAVLAVHSICR